jgi:hypothetical protein
VRVHLSPRNPLAEVGRAILEFDAISVPAREIHHHFPIDTLHLSEIQNDWKSLSIEGQLQFSGMLGVYMTAEREEYEVRIHRPYDLQHRFFPASQTRIDLSVEFFTSFAGIQRAKYVPRHAPEQNVSLRPDITAPRQ